MFTLYRRHEDSCRYKKKGNRHHTCNCPIWMDGLDLKGKRQRRSLKTRSWSHAQERLKRIEGGHEPPPELEKSKSILLDVAVEKYLADCVARKLQPSSVVSYTKTLEHLQTYFPKATVAKIDLDAMTDFRANRKVVEMVEGEDGEQKEVVRGLTASSCNKEIQMLRAFFKFCLKRKWTAENPATDLKPPPDDGLPTMPFTSEEIERILAACDRIGNRNHPGTARARLRARGLVLLLLYSGFRISDAVKLARRKVTPDGRLFVRMMKTRKPLYIRLPEDCMAALRAIPEESPYFFWSGTAKLSTGTGSGRRTIDALMRMAGIEDGHPHRFRDTFAVALLEKGHQLRTVQLLLGHESILTTQKHYAPYVESMQRMLDEAVSDLHFISPPSGPTLVNSHKDTLRDSESDVLPFPRTKSA